MEDDFDELDDFDIESLTDDERQQIQQAFEELAESLKQMAELIKGAVEKFRRMQAIDQPGLNRDDIDPLPYRHRENCHLIPVYKDVHHKGDTFNLTNRKNGRH